TGTPRHERLRARGRRRLPYLFGLRARARWPLGHVSMARPRAPWTQRNGLLVAPPRRIRYALSAAPFGQCVIGKGRLWLTRQCICYAYKTSRGHSAARGRRVARGAVQGLAPAIPASDKERACHDRYPRQSRPQNTGACFDRTAERAEIQELSVGDPIL